MQSNGTPGADPSCRPPEGGGLGPGGDGSDGAGPGTRRPPGGNLRTLAKRRIVFSANKKTVKIPRGLVLKGRIKATKRKATCERKQKVAIQRFAGGSFWQTIDVAVSRKNGRFSVQIFPGPAQTFSYRARVNQTRRCMAATSKRVKIKVVN
jgi:hypothetical protein